jgi:hypothetical protein
MPIQGSAQGAYREAVYQGDLTSEVMVNERFYYFLSPAGIAGRPARAAFPGADDVRAMEVDLDEQRRVPACIDLIEEAMAT